MKGPLGRDETLGSEGVSTDVVLSFSLAVCCSHCLSESWLGNNRVDQGKYFPVSCLISIPSSPVRIDKEKKY